MNSLSLFPDLFLLPESVIPNKTMKIANINMMSFLTICI